MWAGFRRYSNAAISGLPDQINAFRATDMNDVQVTTNLPRKLQGDTDGAQLSLDRTRIQVVPPATLSLTSPLFGQSDRHQIILSVHCDRQATGGGRLHSPPEHFRVRMRKIRCAAPAHERLE